MKSKPTHFWLLLFAFVGLCVWWVLYIPFNAMLLYRAIPQNAVFVSEHDEVAGRWETIARHPLIGGVARALGVDAGLLYGLPEDRGVKAVLDRFAARKTVFAYVPSLGGPGGPPAWVFSSWAGTRGQYLRWGFYSKFLTDLRRVSFQGGAKGWVLDTPDGAASDEKLSFAEFEGILLGCYSSDPEGVRHIVDRFERGSPVVPGFRARSADITPTNVFDTVWLKQPGPANSLLSQEWQCTFSLTPEFAAGHINSQGQTPLRAGTDPGSVDGEDGEGQALRIGDLGAFVGILGDSPAAIVRLPYALVEEVFSGVGMPSAGRSIVGILERDLAEDASIVTSVCDLEYSGRILGFRVPAIIVGVEVADPGRKQEIVTALLDGFTALYGFGLIPRSVVIEGHSIIVAESVGEGVYDKLGLNEYPAFMMVDNWLVFASSWRALSKMLSRSPVAGKAGDGPAWFVEMAGTEEPVFAWFDLAASNEVLVKALAAYDLASYAQHGHRPTSSVRENLEDIKVLIDAARPMKTFVLGLNTDGRDIDARFYFGNESDSPGSTGVVGSVERSGTL